METARRGEKGGTSSQRSVSNRASSGARCRDAPRSEGAQAGTPGCRRAAPLPGRGPLRTVKFHGVFSLSFRMLREKHRKRVGRCGMVALEPARGEFPLRSGWGAPAPRSRAGSGAGSKRACLSNPTPEREGMRCPAFYFRWLDRANFRGFVLGCIEAKFCK